AAARPQVPDPVADRRAAGDATRIRERRQPVRAPALLPRAGSPEHARAAGAGAEARRGDDAGRGRREHGDLAGHRETDAPPSERTRLGPGGRRRRAQDGPDRTRRWGGMRTMTTDRAGELDPRTAALAAMARGSLGHMSPTQRVRGLAALDMRL